MRYEYKPTFDRSLKKLSCANQEKVKSSLELLFDFFDKKIDLPKGLGFKRLGKDYWEIRAGLKIRIIFEISERVVFCFVGDHDQIARFVSK
jgi:mRNA-degrading endonuclease RelE of RelBE toxin-antitoxin system